MTAADRTPPRAGSHLFIVHSHVARWVAQGVIAHEALAPARIVLLGARGMELADAPLRCVPLAIEAVREAPRGALAIWRARRWVRRTDRFLDEIGGRDGFHLYTPHALERAFQLIRSHPRCSGFSFLEEGLYSYCTRAEMDATLPPPQLRRGDRLAFGRRVRAAHFFEPGHTRAYGVHPSVFPDLDHRVILPDPFPPLAPDAAARAEVVLAFDALSVTRRVRLASVCSALERLLDQLRDEGVARLHYKLHPAQRGHAEVAALEATLARHAPALVAERLPDALSLESLARARPALRFYVNLSSVGFYAALAGARAFSFAPWVVEAEPAFAAVVERTPRVFRERVRFLDGSA